MGHAPNGEPVHLADIWPSDAEVRTAVAQVSAEMFNRQYDDVFSGPEAWRAVQVEDATTYAWENSAYIRQPPFFRVGDAAEQALAVRGARILALLGDSVTTDHISPAGAIQPTSPAGEYLQQAGVVVEGVQLLRLAARQPRGDGARHLRQHPHPQRDDARQGRRLHESHVPTGETISIYDAAVRYQGEDTPLVVFAGKEYGTGSSRDWAAKGTRLLGVRAVVAESFERIHRSNLAQMGVLPVVFSDGASRRSLGLTGAETHRHHVAGRR